MGTTNNNNLLEYRRKRGYWWRSRYSIKQKPVLVKLYTDVLVQLENECCVDGCPRNNLINQACRWYCDELDNVRHSVAVNDTPGHSRIVDVLKNALTPEQYRKLCHISRSLAKDIDTIVIDRVLDMLEHYDDVPLNYL